MSLSEQSLYFPPTPANYRRNLTSTRKLQIHLRDGFRCQLCGTSDNLTVDHKRPVCLGGRNVDENLWTLCKRCQKVKSKTENRQVLGLAAWKFYPLQKGNVMDILLPRLPRLAIGRQAVVYNRRGRGGKATYLGYCKVGNLRPIATFRFDEPIHLISERDFGLQEKQGALL